MLVLCKELAGMDAPLDDHDFPAMILTSIPKSFHSFLCTTTTAICEASATVTSEKIISLVFEEADHRNLRKSGAADDIALNSSTKECRRTWRSRCFNCECVGHMKDNCWQKGGGKEGQGLHQKKKAKSVNTAMLSPDTDYVFLMSTLTKVTNTLVVPPERCGAIINSGALSHFCPNREKFTNFTAIHPKPIRIADSHTLHATGRGNI
ncbi:hypothetical protein PAXINDRAFT_38852, partial [Paxillus involutus ATCC 200175]